ncbi:hypothetical protein A2U01_0068130, partial [Trifolium medium]|nr:hypothetical protein [Trifolium medium]
GPRHDVPSYLENSQRENAGRRSPTWSFQTHKFHDDDFLDTEPFAYSRESREVKNGEKLPIAEF